MSWRGFRVMEKEGAKKPKPVSGLLETPAGAKAYLELAQKAARDSGRDNVTFYIAEVMAR